MPALTIDDGGLALKDPADILVYRFDWGTLNLDDGVAIVTSVFTITLISGGSATPLTKDGESIVGGNRMTQLRLTGGTLGARYRIDNKITTNEIPAQTKERSFKLKIEQK